LIAAGRRLGWGRYRYLENVPQTHGFEGFLSLLFALLSSTARSKLLKNMRAGWSLGIFFLFVFFGI
jgi:hypothetical protein